MISSIKVKLWGEVIGILAWDTRQQNSYFYFNPEYKSKEQRPFPLGLHERILSGNLPAYGDTDHPQNQKLPYFLAGSLPDDWGNELFEQWRVQNRIPLTQITPLDKLSFIGNRGMGALEFEPDVRKNQSAVSLDVENLMDLARKIQDGRESYVLSAEEELTMDNLIAVGTSVGGRMAKALIAVNRKSGEIRSGQIAGQKDADYYLLKFGMANRSTAEIEMVYYEMARKAGIRMMDSSLMVVQGEKHFLTRRFDRVEGEKLHMLTLAAIRPEADSYEQLFQVCRDLGLAPAEGEEIFRRMVFNVLSNNTDDHSRNFSFLMDRNGQWSLAPAYDLTYIFNERGGWLPKEERCLMINGKKADISREDLMVVAYRNDISRPEKIIREIADILKGFRQTARQVGMKDEWAGRIDSCIRRRLLDFGFIQPLNRCSGYKDENGRCIDNIQIEPALNGVYRLTATIDGRNTKFILGPNKPGYNFIRDNGETVALMPEKAVRALVDIYLLKKGQMVDEKTGMDKVADRDNIGWNTGLSGGRKR